MGRNMVSEAGFYVALHMMMALVAGALVLLGPPCSLWVFMPRSFHGRSKDRVHGDESKLLVRSANVQCW